MRPRQPMPGSQSADDLPMRPRQPMPGRKPIHIGRADSIGAQSGRRIGSCEARIREIASTGPTDKLSVGPSSTDSANVSHGGTLDPAGDTPDPCISWRYFLATTLTVIANMATAPWGTCVRRPTLHGWIQVDRRRKRQEQGLDHVLCHFGGNILKSSGP